MFSFNRTNFSRLMLPFILSLVFVLGACNDSNYSEPEPVEPAPAPMEYSYKITLSNLSNGQPLSPIAVILHATGEIWTLGQPASLSLENLAESGDNSSLLAESFVIANASNNGILAPGEEAEIMLTSTDASATFLSLATMLVNTNDAFTGLNRVDLSRLAVDEMLTFRAAVYDAGTEANSESAGTIPGPADGGEGFNTQRDDINFVARHSGIVSSQDGLTDSVLNNQHKFDNPLMLIKITRLN